MTISNQDKGNKSLKTAILLGATGLTGSLLLEMLIKDQRFEKIKVFSRRATGVKHKKLEEIICNLFELEKYKQAFIGDVVYCCIGTTMKKTPDQELYKKIDFGIPVNASLISEANKISTFILISAIGANSDSGIFYNRLKGEMEAEVLKREIPNIYILRPSLIVGKRNEFRLGEDLGKILFKFLDWTFIGPLQKYRSIKAETIAITMKKLSFKQLGRQIFDSNEIKKWAKE